MIDKEHLLGGHAHLVHQNVLDPQLLIEVADHRLTENLPRPGKGAQGAQQDTLELDKRLLVKDNIVEILSRDTRRLKTELDRMARETIIVLLAGEALFLSSRNQQAITQQRSRRVVIETRDAQNIHQDCSRASFIDGFSGNSLGCQLEEPLACLTLNGSARSVTPTPKGKTTTKYINAISTRLW